MTSQKLIVNLFQDFLKTKGYNIELEHDLPTENRMFLPKRSYVMSEWLSNNKYQTYRHMEKVLNDCQIPKKSYSVHAWIDSSGYYYWKEEDGSYINIELVFEDTFNIDDFENALNDLIEVENKLMKFYSWGTIDHMELLYK